MGTDWRALALIALASWATACSDAQTPGPDGTLAQPASRVCLPGVVQSCTCTDGTQGVSTCDARGAAMGACQCATSAMAMVQTDGMSAGASPGISVPGNDGAATTGDVGAAGADAQTPVVVLPPEPVMARDIRISELAIFQAVKISLAQDGEPVAARNAPVIVGKEGIVRVYVETLPGFVPRELEAHLTLSSAESPVESQVVKQRIDGSSREDDLASTIVFDIPQGTVSADLRYSVELRELDGTAEPTTGTLDPAVRFPLEEDTLSELGARDAGTLRVMLVPYRYTADGSGRLPVITDEQIQLFRDYIFAYYPIIDVEIELHDPVDYNGSVGPNNGWETWLDNHCALRTDEDPDPKLLYYGVMAPRTDARAYGGGVVGISYLPGPAANFGRCSVGVGFEGAIAASTMAHELGHSLGLPHAPCGVSGGPFPYAEASIGEWGFGLSSRTLKDPTEFKDLMSYCDPVFISDYNYQKLFERIRYLNLQFNVEGDDVPENYVRVLQTPDGQRRVTGDLHMQRAPGGDEEARAVDLFDDTGAHLGQVVGYFFPSSEEGGGLWLVPDRGAAEAALEDGARVVLP